MAWFVQALQKKNADGTPAGVWHLCAQSDEGGGFYAGCDHDHPSPEEAQDCREAKISIGATTGFPYQPAKITVNGTVHEVDGDTISHEQICALAGKPVHASATYLGPRNGDSERSGITHVGKSVKLEDGMIFNCVVTGNA
jgi:hypothetical protein